jgi:hypothetical protein
MVHRSTCEGTCRDSFSPTRKFDKESIHLSRLLKSWARISCRKWIRVHCFRQETATLQQNYTKPSHSSGFYLNYHFRGAMGCRSFCDVPLHLTLLSSRIKWYFHSIWEQEKVTLLLPLLQKVPCEDNLRENWWQTKIVFQKFSLLKLRLWHLHQHV